MFGMELVLAEGGLFTLHNLVYFVVATIVAAAIINKTKMSNLNMIWLIPASWIGLGILFGVLGALFKWVALPILIVGGIVVGLMYAKKETTREVSESEETEEIL